jgi:hypothetical protein
MAEIALQAVTLYNEDHHKVAKPQPKELWFDSQVVRAT